MCGLELMSGHEHVPEDHMPYTYKTSLKADKEVGGCFCARWVERGWQSVEKVRTKVSN